MVMDITHYKNDGEISLQILGPQGEKVLEYYPGREEETALVQKNLQDISYVNPDNMFLKRVQDVIYTNMKNEQFGVEDLSRELSLSRTQLYRNVVSLLGMPPKQLIQKQRLNEAYKLIKNSSESIAEIAFNVGFSSPSYFIKVFKEEFGITPSKLRRNPTHMHQTMYFLHQG
jgi:AraC-like DNA-binding protein